MTKHGIRTILLVVLFFLSYSPKLQAGSATSGGGGTHTCFNDDSSVKSTELYDLYEGREAYNYKMIDPSGKTANELLNLAMKKIFKSAPMAAVSIKKYLDYYSKNKVVKENKRFTVINDASIVFIDVNCQYRQIAQWQDKYEKIFIDGDLYKNFSQSPLNIAALALHEAIYAYERKHRGSSDSDHARKLVAQAFSDSEFELKEDRYENSVNFNFGSKYSLRFTRVKNDSTAEVYADRSLANEYQCNLTKVKKTCLLQLNFIESAFMISFGGLPFPYRPGGTAEVTIQAEVLANGHSVHSQEYKVYTGPIENRIEAKTVYFFANYENLMEKQILSLQL